MKLSARWILAGAYLVFVLYAYPGYMTTDAVHQLVEARAGSFTDSTPTVMTELWRLTGFVVSGPAALLLLQGALLLLGTYALLSEHWQARAAAVGAAIVLLFPPILATEAVIWPQSLLAGCGIAAAALLGARDRRCQLAAVPLVFVGCSLGHGAALALLPVVALRCNLARGWRRYAVAVAAWAALTVAAWAANEQLVDHVTHRDGQATVATRVLGLEQPHALLAVYSDFLGAPAQLDETGHLASHSSIQRALVASVDELRQTPLFHPYVYGLLAVLLLALAFVWRARDAAMLLAAGIAGELAMLATAPEAQLRYSLWLILTTVLAIPILVAARVRTATVKQK